MALNQIPWEEKNVGFQACLNIGNAFVKIEKYREAIWNYEAAMSSSPYHETSVNELLCYVVLGDAEESKRCFTKTVSLPLNQVGKEEGKFASEINSCKGSERCGDLLEEELVRRSKSDEKVFITESLLVASVFGGENWDE